MDNTRSSLRQPAGSATEWTARGLQGKPQVPPASPMESMVRTLRTPVNAAPPPAAPAAPTYRPPAVDPRTGVYARDHNGGSLRMGTHETQAGQRPLVESRPGSVPRTGGPQGAAPSVGQQSLWGRVKDGTTSAGRGAKYVASGEFLNADIGGAAKSVGGKLISALRNPMVSGYLAGQGIAGAVKGFDTPTEEYRARAGMDRTGGLGGDLLARSVGVLADVGDAVTFGGASKLGRYLAGQDQEATLAGAPADAAPTRPVPAAQPTVTASSSPALRDPTPTRRVNGGSSPLFTNLPEGSADSAALMGRGAISPRNMAAADALSARYATQPQAEAPGGAAAAFIPKDTGGYGLLDRDRLRERSLRMDADQLKPGSRSALRAFYSRQEQQDKNESAERTAANNATTLRRGQDISAETDRRGQDMDLQGKLAPVRQAGVLRQMKAQVMQDAGGDYRVAARNWAAQGGDPKDFLDPYTSEQSGLSNARDNLRKEFQIIDPKTGKPDEAASSQAFDAVRQIYPKLESANEGDRNSVIGDAKELYGIFNNARNQDKVGWDALKFWEPARPQLRSLPKVVGGQTENLSGLDGMTTIGASNGDTLLTLNGKTLNLGKLNERQIELLERAKTKGWGQ